LTGHETYGDFAYFSGVLYRSPSCGGLIRLDLCSSSHVIPV
jgi:hypothetical protein